MITFGKVTGEACERHQIFFFNDNFAQKQHWKRSPVNLNKRAPVFTQVLYLWRSVPGGSPLLYHTHPPPCTTIFFFFYLSGLHTASHSTGQIPLHVLLPRKAWSSLKEYCSFKSHSLCGTGAHFLRSTALPTCHQYREFLNSNQFTAQRLLFFL